MARPVRFFDLPDDMITEILSRLPNEELFRIESVSKSTQMAVRRVLNRVDAIAFPHSYRPPSLTVTCDHISAANDTKTLSIPWDETPATSVVDLLKRCPQVKCLDLRLVDNIDSLTMIVKACPQLECLYMVNVKSIDSKWKSFVVFVGQRLRHLSMTDNTKRPKTAARFEMLVKACSLLERCHLECHHNSLDKSLKYLKPEQTVLSLETDRQVSNVSHRIEGLTVNHSTLKAIAERKDNKLDQLRQLTLICSNSNNNIPSIDFSALETLKLFGSFVQGQGAVFHGCLTNRHLWKEQRLLELAEGRFPKLRTLHLKTFGGEEAFKTLFNKFNNLKRLILDNLHEYDSMRFFLPAPGKSLAKLTQLETVDVFMELIKLDYQLPSVFAMVETLAKMKTVKKVRMRFEFDKSFTPISKKQMQQLARGVGRLKKQADTVKVELAYVNWVKKNAQQQLDDWNKTFCGQPQVKRIQQRQETEDERDQNSDDGSHFGDRYSKEVEKLVIWL